MHIQSRTINQLTKIAMCKYSFAFTSHVCYLQMSIIRDSPASPRTYRSPSPWSKARISKSMQMFGGNKVLISIILATLSFLTTTTSSSLARYHKRCYFLWQEDDDLPVLVTCWSCSSAMLCRQVNSPFAHGST